MYKNSVYVRPLAHEDVVCMCLCFAGVPPWLGHTKACRTVEKGLNKNQKYVKNRGRP